MYSVTLHIERFVCFKTNIHKYQIYRFFKKLFFSLRTPYFPLAEKLMKRLETG